MKGYSLNIHKYSKTSLFVFDNEVQHCKGKCLQLIATTISVIRCLGTMIQKDTNNVLNYKAFPVDRIHFECHAMKIGNYRHKNEHICTR